MGLTGVGASGEAKLAATEVVVGCMGGGDRGTAGVGAGMEGGVKKVVGVKGAVERGA